MLVVGFNFAIKDVRELRNTKKLIPVNFMKMKIWEVLTEEQFNSLHDTLHKESIEQFIELAVLMNKEQKRKRKRENAKTERARELNNIAVKKYREKNKDKIKEYKKRKYYEKKREVDYDGRGNSNYRCR